MSMRLLVLGLLLERDRHPYDIRQVIRDRNWHHAFHIKDGSLYYAVDQMRAQGLIEAAETVRLPGEGRPDKTIYRITDAGRLAFTDLLHGQLNRTPFPQHPLFVALPFIKYGEWDRVRQGLDKQLEACQGRVSMLNDVLAVKENRLPQGAVHLIRAIRDFSLTEMGWLQAMIADAASGKLFEGKPGEAGAADES